MLADDRMLPTGTVTLLFTDIEGSTTRWDSHREAMQAAVRRHDELLRGAIETHDGFVFKTIGDAFCAAFGRASDAILAAIEAQRAVAREDWSAVGGLRVRVAVHAGVTEERDADYFGPTVNRVARLLSIGHGGQVLVSGAAKSLVDEHLPDGTSLVDLGLHRLKDLTAPEHVYQLDVAGLGTEFAPLRSLDALPNNLPAQLSPMVGRDAETAEVKRLLGESRLVTLIGSGGIGKTRVALQAAADMATGDGAWFVDLAACDDPAMLPSAIAAVFGIADEGGSQRLIERVAAALRLKRLLLVLDNCEHVIAVAAESVQFLLQLCVEMRVLATSREPLGIGGEELYRMPPLPTPPERERMTAGRIVEYGAATLFIARARAAHNGFVVTDQNAETIAEIVRQLDGIPLAIELAAARVKALKLPQLLQRLDDRLKLLTGGSRTALPRQQTLRALIAWSYDLLTDAERSVFRQIAVCRGTWTLDAAEAIWCDAAHADSDVLNLVAALVDKSLVVADGDEDADEQRYRLLASTREFALECLANAGEDRDAAKRHCHFYTERAREAGNDFWATESDRWTSRILADVENYRGAIHWGFESGNDAEAAASVVASLRWHWNGTARGEGRAYVERASAALPPSAPAELRGMLALAASALLVKVEGNDPALEAERIFTDTADVVPRAEALNALADTVGGAGRFAESVELAQAAVTAARESGLPRLIGCVLSTAGYWSACAGDDTQAAAYLDEADPIVRRCNDRPALARLDAIRAEVAFKQGDAARALIFVREAQSIYRQRRHVPWLCTTLLNGAAYLLVTGDAPTAWSSAREALELALECENSFLAAIAVGHLARMCAERDPERAARLAGFVDAFNAREQIVREPTEQQGYEELLALVRGSLTEDRLNALLAEGAAMDQASAAADALAIPQPAGA